MHTGPKLTNENVIFGFDTGYGLNQGSSTRHYKGEPATNLITAGLPGYFGSGGETLYKNNHYGLNSDSGVFQRNFVTNPATANTSAFNNNAGLYKNFTTAALSSNTEYVLVSFDFYMITPYVRHSSSSTGLNGYLGVLYTDGSTGNHGWNTSLNTPNAGDDWNNNSAYIGQWRKIALYVDLVNAKTPASISSVYIYNDRTVTGEGIFTNFVITEHATVPTGPVLYTSGTRSDTASLIDLKKTTDIDVSSISFDSTGQPTFDGSNDVINLDSQASVIPVGGPITIESIVIWDDLTPNGVIVSYGGNQSGAGFLLQNEFSAGLEFVLFDGNGNSGRAKILTANSTQYLDKYIHMVGTYDGSTILLYINGVQAATASYTNGYPSQSYFRIGNEYNRSYFANIDLGVLKIYDATLSATEVAENYNTYKNRFNL